MRQKYNNNNNRQQQRQPLTPEQEFELKLKKFLKVSTEKHADLKKTIDRKVKDNRYKLSIKRFPANRKAGE